MGNVADDETRVILRKLAWFVPSFYVLFYAVAALYLAALGVSFDHLGAAPFLFDDDDFKPLLREAGQADRQLPLGAPRLPHPPFNTRRIIHHRHPRPNPSEGVNEAASVASRGRSRSNIRCRRRCIRVL